MFLWKYSTDISQKTVCTNEPLTSFIYNFWSSGVTKEIVDNSLFSLEVKEISKSTQTRK